MFRIDISAEVTGMVDPMMHGLGWRLSRQGERERREAERNLGRVAARLRRWWPRRR